MTDRPDPNWAYISPLLPIATLAEGFDGPVVLADETQTIRWFVNRGEKRGPIEHREHARDEHGIFLHEPGPQPEEGSEEVPEATDGEPIYTTSTIEPAFWAMVEVVE